MPDEVLGKGAPGARRHAHPHELASGSGSPTHIGRDEATTNDDNGHNSLSVYGIVLVS